MWDDKGNLLRPQVSVWQSFLLPPIVLDGSHLYVPILGLGTGAETGREVSGLGSGGVYVARLLYSDHQVVSIQIEEGMAAELWRRFTVQ